MFHFSNDQIGYCIIGSLLEIRGKLELRLISVNHGVWSDAVKSMFGTNLLQNDMGFSYVPPAGKRMEYITRSVSV